MLLCSVMILQLLDMSEKMALIAALVTLNVTLTQSSALWVFTGVCVGDLLNYHKSHTKQITTVNSFQTENPSVLNTEYSLK